MAELVSNPYNFAAQASTGNPYAAVPALAVRALLLRQRKQRERAAAVEAAAVACRRCGHR